MRDIAARAAELGIEAEYVDARGVQRRIAPAALERLVSALELHAGGRQTLVWRHGRTQSLNIAGKASRWRLLSADKEIARGRLQDGQFRLPADSAPGVYRLALSDSRNRVLLGDANVLVAPVHAYQLDDVAHERIWVLAVQLYAVRSHSNWGHGDFGDLKRLVQLAAEVGAAGIGVNPLHALFDDRPEQASPYAPNSRLFLNPLYIDLDSVPEFSGTSAHGSEGIEQLRATAQVNYAAVAAAKQRALRAAFAAFTAQADPRRRADFEAFRRERGPALARFAAFEVLRRRLPQVWWEWPPQWRSPAEAALAALRAEAGEELAFYEFVQWLADRQLADCQNEARRLGLPIGLYLDVAVGVEPGGADAWSAQDSIVPQVEMGAPPDLLNTAGQAWGLAAFNPRALEAQGLAPFADLLAAAMRHAGAIRLDHVLGLNRAFLIPSGYGAQDGGYVRYPLQALLGMVALASMQHRCLVIGEDLGTVPDELRAALADWGVWSYLVMMFERDAHGAFKPSQDYRRNALVTFSTHDLPSFPGWRIGHDLGVKQALGIDPGESMEERGRAHWLMGEALARAGLSVDRDWDYLDVVRFLARTRSRVMAIALDDVLGVLDQPNVPGTTEQHPNWRRRLPVTLEELAAHEGLRAVARALAEEGRSLRRK